MKCIKLFAGFVIFGMLMLLGWETRWISIALVGAIVAVCFLVSAVRTLIFSSSFGSRKISEKEQYLHSELARVQASARELFTSTNEAAIDAVLDEFLLVDKHMGKPGSNKVFDDDFVDRYRQALSALSRAETVINKHSARRLRALI